MTKSISQSMITERKNIINERISKLERFVLEENMPNLAKKAFEINLRHLREEYKQLELLKKNLTAVAAAITAGVIGSVVSVYVMSMVFKLEHVHYVSLLPKSITTAIGMGVSEEAGGIVTMTIVSIILTGILGNIVADGWFKLVGIKEPIAKGLALGTSAHAIGTAKALELGEVEGAMSSLSIAVAGLMTVVAVPIMSGLL